MSDERITKAMRLVNEYGQVCRDHYTAQEQADAAEAIGAYLTQLLDDTVKDAIACTLEAQLLQPTDDPIARHIAESPFGDLLDAQPEPPIDAEIEALCEWIKLVADTPGAAAIGEKVILKLRWLHRHQRSGG